MLDGFWRRMKAWRRIVVGPVALVFKFERSVRVTKGSAAPTPVIAVSSSAAADPSTSAVRQITVSSPPAISTPLLGTAVIVGVGPGFGYALARRLAEDGFDLVLVSRDADRLAPLIADLRSGGGTVASYGGDATDEKSVDALFARIMRDHGTPTLVVYAVQYFGPGETIDVDLPAFETSWRHNCLGAFVVSRAAARAMEARKEGSIFLIGSTSSIVGREGHLNLAVGKFGQRALAQVLARELWPKGIHVAHVIIDADIAENPLTGTSHRYADPEDVAFSIAALHKQPRSAWTSELDLRPWNEKFWEHC